MAGVRVDRGVILTSAMTDAFPPSITARLTSRHWPKGEPLSILVRVELVRTSHDDDERPQRVQHLDRVALRLEDFG